MVMQRKFSKTYVQTERKTDTRFVKDSGDNIQRNDKQWNRRPDEDQRRVECDVSKVVLPDRGDSQTKEKNKPNRSGVAKVKERHTKEETNKLIEYVYGNDTQNKTYADLDRRRRIRERYTIRKTNKEDLSNTEKADLKIDQSKKQVTTDTCHKSIQNSREELASSKFGNETCKTEASSRKPLIKSIIKGDTMRRYKAVTFVDQKEKTAPLQIDLNRVIVNKQKIAKSTDAGTLNSNTKATPSKLTVKEKRHRKISYRPKRKYRKQLSPDSMCRRIVSPPTEVAKWAPDCLDQHTKPYYEAWINTTLAAINKCSKNDKLYAEKQNIIHHFRKMLEAPTRVSSPEIKYEDYTNELFTGRIKIRQRKSKKRS